MDYWIYIAVWASILVFSIMIEITTVQLTSIWFAAGSFVALILAVFKVPLYIQIIVFVVLSIALLLLTRPLSKKLMNNKKSETTVPAESLVGEIVTVTKEISVGGFGEIKDRYEYYSAVAPREKEIIQKDEKVKIIGLDGNKVLVERL